MSIEVGWHRSATRQQHDLGRQQFTQPRQFALQPRVVFGIDQAQGHCPRAVLLRRPGNLRRGQARAQIGDVPAEIRRRCPDEQRAQLMDLPRRCRDHQHGRIFRSAERLRGLPKENPNTALAKCSCAAVMVPSRHKSPMVCASGATTRCSNPWAPSAVAARFSASSKARESRVFTAAKHLRGTNRLQALWSAVARRGDWRQPIRRRAGAASASAISPRGRCFGRLASARASRVKPLDLFSRVKAAVGVRALWLHRAVALLPNPNDVRAQPGAKGDQFDGMLDTSHVFIQTFYNLGSESKQIITQVEILLPYYSSHKAYSAPFGTAFSLAEY